MSSYSDIEIRDVTDVATFALLPGCADPRFDHRSCDYWEDEVRGDKTARPAWWTEEPIRHPAPPKPRSTNPFAPPVREADEPNPFAPAADPSGFNPFAPASEVDPDAVIRQAPRKLRMLDRGHAIFGSYAKVLLHKGRPAGFAQFGPLTAYPRAQSIRGLYPALPASPLPAVITCIATTTDVRGQGLASALVEAVAVDLAGRGFAAIESYPDLSLHADEASTATPAFWIRCGFQLVADDERYPVMRRELD